MCIRDRGHTVPVLLVSAETTPTALRALHDTGHAVYTKPVSPDRLRAWLEHVTVAPTEAEPDNRNAH